MTQAKRYTVWTSDGALIDLSWEDVRRITGIPDSQRPRVDRDVWPRAIVYAGFTIEPEGVE